MRILELGSGLGVAGTAVGSVTARRSATDVVLTDQDAEALDRLERLCGENEVSNLQMSSRFLDWRNDHSKQDEDDFDVVVGSDCVYYHHLVGPLADTIETFGSNKALMVMTGPPTRQSVWELYHLIKDGGYNVKTDVYGEPWPGKVYMLFYRLVCQEDEQKYTVPMAIMCWTQNPEMLKGIQSVMEMEETFVATEEDEATIEMGF